MFQPTNEQQSIIHHPIGSHARVLAVAGSGKTSTYVRLALALDTLANQIPPWRTPIRDEGDDSSRRRSPPPERQDEALRMILATANTPSRKLPREALTRVASDVSFMWR